MKIKSFILVVFAICFSTMAYSQTNKGNWIVSGSTSLQIMNVKPEGGDASTTVTLTPSVGYFIVDNFSLGANLNLLSMEDLTTISVLPTATYYFETNSYVKPLISLGIGYASMSLDDGYDDETFGGLALGVGAGMVLMLNQNVGFDIGIQYLRNDFDYGIVNTFGGVLGFSVFF